MAEDKALASGIRSVEHLRAFDEMIRDRYGDMALQDILVYLVDTVPQEAVVWLARQFGIMGYEGWAFVPNSPLKQRELVKQAIELHRRKGTPWSIRNAIERGTGIEAGRVSFVEGTALTPPVFHNYTVFYSYHVTYGAAAHWADFAVVIDVTDIGIQLNAALYPLLLALIQEYKPARSHLASLDMAYHFEEEKAIEEELVMELTMAAFEEEVQFNIYYDGSYNYDGSLQYDTDFLTLTVIT